MKIIVQMDNMLTQMEFVLIALYKIVKYVTIVQLALIVLLDIIYMVIITVLLHVQINITQIQLQNNVKLVLCQIVKLAQTLVILAKLA